MKLYFVRHGESQANLLREFSNRGLKHPLTEKGRAQALALAERLGGISFRKIYTSPLLRARQTAEILSAALGVPCEAVDALGEFDTGIFEGRSDEASWQVFAELWQAWSSGQRLDEGLPGGESFNDIRRRFVPFIERIVQESPAEDAVLLVGHGGTFLHMLPLLTSNLTPAFMETHSLPNTAVVIIETRPGGLVCLSWDGEVLIK